MPIADRSEHQTAATAERFRSPPNEFRPMPFWGLNDELQDAELRRQIKEMKRGGWGGFFVHPRYGMETPYLGAEYMERMKTIVHEAKRQDLEMWLYDEHPFPAGCAGGLVGAEKREHRHRALVMRVHTRLTPIDEGVAYFAATPDAKTGLPTRLRPIDDPRSDDGAESTFLHFYEWEMPVAPTSLAVQTNEFIHGFPYTDLLNPAAVRRFIELTYEAYRETLGEDFGRSLKGVFSDIPVYHWHYASPRPSVPWTSRLPRVFSDRCGYDLIPNLPSLFYDVGDYRRIRLDFWRTVQHLFLESFTKQVSEWCSANSLIYTAHYWGEETLHWQVAWTGDVMEHFSRQHYVANDHILRNIDDPIGIKQAASVAEQLGKPRMITETYALSGHNLTFEERKWIGDWQYALGSNFLVPYIPAYSMRGRRKRDEPPSEFFQQPYWEHEGLLSDYFARLGYALTRGERVVDILVLQPLATAQALFKPGAETPPGWHPTEDPYEGAGAELFGYSEAFRHVCDWLLRMKRDFHFGNEALLATHGSVKDGRLRVARASYQVVVVPPSITWSPRTVELLKQFSGTGGRIIAVEPLPTLVDARKATRVLPAKTVVIPATEEALGRALDQLIDADVRVDDAPDVIRHHRRDGDTDIYFLANTSLQTSYPDVAVRLEGTGPVERWDLLSGERQRLAFKTERDGVGVRLDFAQVGSHLLVLGRRGEPEADYRALPKRFERVVRLDGTWALRTLDPNCLTLDYCRINVGDGDWSELIPTWRAHQLLIRAGVGTAFRLRFGFRTRRKPARVSIALEDPERYETRVNGVGVSSRGSEPWWDPRLPLLDITASTKLGANEIEIAGRFGLGTEIEPCFVVGEFGVDRSRAFEITAVPHRVKGENLVDDGYPFFRGRAILSKEVTLPRGYERAYLRFDVLEAIIATVRVNDVEAGRLAWKPYMLDITKQAKAGRNRIEVELCTSLHNLLGPHHDKRGEVRHFVIDRCWMDAADWTDDYFFVPVGTQGAAIGLTGSPLR